MLSEHMHQDIARSSYADMLNDDERNLAYNNAIDLSVRHLVASQLSNPNGDRFFRCCDIGTGSGLLSMMVVRSFKKLNYDKFHVQAFEAFEPMAQCAKKVIEQNDMSKYITVIPARSDLYTSEQRPQFDLLVAELLDTELIGEGCLEIYRHAIENLCSPNCLFVPHSARVYIEPVASRRLFSRHAIRDLQFDIGSGYQVKIPIADEIKNCPGMPEIDDMQASALKEGEDFHRFSGPQPVFEFTFGDIESLRLTDYKRLTFPIEKGIGEPPVVVMWWDIVMYDSSLEVSLEEEDSKHSWRVLSCAPNWARSAQQLARDQFIKEKYGREVWREHWIQGVYYFSSIPETLALLTADDSYHEQSVTVHAYHDAYSLWFDLKKCQTRLPHNCTCGVHRKLSRSQLAYLSDSNQMTSLLYSTLYPHLKPDATGGVSREYPVVIQAHIEFQHQDEALGDTVTSSSLTSGPKWKILFREPPGCGHDELLFEEPPFLMDLALANEIPWSNIMLNYLSDSLADIRLPEPIMGFEIKFTQVQFDNLNRIRTNIRDCEGFNLSDLDDMINYSSKYVDKELEAHYLWEYPCTRIDSTDYSVFCSSTIADDSPDDSFLDQRERINSGTYWRHFRLPIISTQQAHDGTINHSSWPQSWQKGWALAFWVELKLKHPHSQPQVLSLGPQSNCRQPSQVSSTGESDVGQLRAKPKLGERIEWNRSCKQLVYFLHDHPIVAPQTTVSKLTTSTVHQEQASIHLDVGLSKFQLMVQRAVDYNTSPLKSKRLVEETN